MNPLIINERISVTWSYQLSKKHKAYLWPELELSEDPIEEKLNLAPGSLCVLNWAFKKKLPRSTPWDLCCIQNPQAYQNAARIYKRGVKIADTDDEILNGRYDILFIDDKEQLVEYLSSRRSNVFIDENLLTYWSELKFAQSFKISENEKNLVTLAKIYEAIKQTEGDCILIGGGVFCDIAAFAASLAGRKFSLVPTTLLAMVDACVGGKTGVNFKPYGKNQLGHFAFPKEVLIWSNWLKSLDKKEMKAGYAEALKHALLSKDNELLQVFESKNFEGLLLQMLPRFIKVKSKIVEQDPSEQAQRASLNLGHSFAHALEAISQQKVEAAILHGQAVALGLIFAALLSHKLNLLSIEKTNYILELIKKNDLALSKQELALLLGGVDLTSEALIDDIMSAILQDKKNDDANISRWVLLKDIGEVAHSNGIYTVAVARQDILETYELFLDQLD